MRCQVKSGSVCFRMAFLPQEDQAGLAFERIHYLQAGLGQEFVQAQGPEGRTRDGVQSPNISSRARCLALSDILRSVISRHKITLPTSPSGLRFKGRMRTFR